MKKAVSLILSLALLLIPAPAALADGADAVPVYEPGTFVDVPDGAWYMDELIVCYESGFMKGKAPAVFAPAESITLAESIAIAARVHLSRDSEAGKKAGFTQGMPWYQVYVDYALENGIIRDGEFPDYNAPATRRQFAGIMYRALQDTPLPDVSCVEDGAIPDVDPSSPYYDEIYGLYRAGILAGTYGGSFLPGSSIARCEAAAIVARSEEPALLKRFMLTRDGFFSCYEGGVGFKVPSCYTVRENAAGVNGFLAKENGKVAGAMVVLSRYLPMSRADFEENRTALAEAVVKAAGLSPISSPVISEGTLLGFPAVTVELASAEMGSIKASTRYRVDIFLNVKNSRMVAVILGYTIGCERDYTALYTDMLGTAKADGAAGSSANARPGVAQIVCGKLNGLDKLPVES